MIWNALLLALREIRNNLLRAGLTTLGIVIGVGAVILMVTWEPPRRRKSRANSLRSETISSRSFPASRTARRRPSPPSTCPLSTRSSAKFRSVAGRAGTREQAVLVNGNHNHNSQVNGTTNAYLHSRNWALVAGREFSPAELLAGNPCASWARPTGASCSATRSHRPADPHQQDHCEVIGVLEPKGVSTFGQDMDELALMPLKAVQRESRQHRSQRHSRPGRPLSTNIPHVKDLIQRLCARRATSFRARSMISTSRTFRQNLRNRHDVTLVLTAFLSAVAAVSLLVGGIGIMNIMLVR